MCVAKQTKSYNVTTISNSTMNILLLFHNGGHQNTTVDVVSMLNVRSQPQ